MAEGIKLTFDNAQTTVEEEEKECFAGVFCGHLEYRKKQITLHDGNTVSLKTYWCKHKNRSATDFIDDQCPLNKWRKLAVPIGYQNVGKQK